MIPRPESELLVELALELEPASVLDVGTGSGALALAIADELPDCAVVATDVSADALAVARANAALLGFEERVRFERGTLPAIDAVDLLVANLPYVRDDEWPALQPEITKFEPRGALLAGADGLATIGALVAALGGTGGSAPRAHAVGLEVGQGQADRVAELLAAAGFTTETRADLAGIERCVVGRLR